MYERLEDIYFINIPNGVLNSLTKKARAELENAVNNYRPTDYVHYNMPQSYQGSYGSQHAMNSLMISMDGASERTLQAIMRATQREKLAIERAKELENTEKELSILKNSLKAIKGAME